MPSPLPRSRKAKGERAAIVSGPCIVLAGDGGAWWRSVATQMRTLGCADLWSVPRAIAELPLMQDAQRDVHAADVVVLIPDKETTLAELLRAAGMLREWDTPGVAALDAVHESHADRLRAAGLHVVSRTESPQLAAGLIAGLASRQPTVRRMHGEMQTAWRAHEQAGSLISRVDEELRLAARVQSQLLPRVFPTDAGLSFGVVFRPAGYVSGDIFRVEALADGRIGVLLADVMGHGVKAAMHSILVAQSLPMQDRLGDRFGVLDPVEAMARLNAELVRHRQDDANFATAVYGLIDPRDWTVRIASAGHPPTVCAGDSGEARRSTATGPMLGVFDEAEFTEDRFTLQPGGTLVFYTDGVEQALAPAVSPTPKGVALMDEAVRRIAAIASQERTDVRAAAQGVHNLLDSQSGSLHQGDDVSVLLIRRD